MKKLYFLITLSFTIITTSIFPQEILINEFQSSNSVTIADSDGEFSDWIEIYSLLDSTINLQGWFLSDDFENPFKWQFPSKLFPSEELMLIFASGKDTLYPNGELHTSFKLGNGTEPVILSRPDSTICDYAAIIQINTDWSYGRYPDASGDWFFFSEPTPGDFNTTQPFADFAEPPAFSHDAGFYENEFYLEMFPVNPGDTIYYTLDGSTPTRNSLIYVEPILMKNRANEPNRLSMIRTTLPGQGFHNWREPNGNVYKFNVIRARTFNGDDYPSKVVSKSFIVEPQMWNRYKYPVISIITDSVNFFCDTTGIYVAGVNIDSTDWTTANFSQNGREWERPVHLEVFDQGNLVLSQDAGVRIGGNYTRTTNVKQLRLYARSEYSKPTFEYSFFPNHKLSEFYRIRLRNTGNDAQNAYMRDALVHEIVRNMGIDISDWRPSIVFLDGEYWGIHFIRDRIDKYYFLQHYGIADDQLDFLEMNSAVVEGDNAHYQSLISFVSNNNMSDGANYQHVTTLLDPDNYIKYLVVSIYTGQTDWPVHNIRYWRKKTDQYIPNAPFGHDGRWRWALVDQDFGLGRNSNMAENFNHLGRILFSLSGWQNRLMINLLGNNNLPGNETFRHQFINTFADHMNTTFIPARMLEKYNMFFDTIFPEMPEHIRRWRYPASMHHWQNVYCFRIPQFINNRPAFMRSFIVQDFNLDGLYNLTADVIDPSHGKIRISTITIDSNTLGLDNPAQPYPWTGIYFAGVPVEVEAIPNPGYIFSHWEGASDATEPIITIDPEGDVSLIAHFVPEPVIERELIHYWHFNNLPSGTLNSVAADFSLTGNTAITYPGTGAGYMDNRTHRAQDPVSNLNLHLGQQPNQGAVLRVRNPSDTRQLIIKAPTTGFESIEIAFATARTSSGATQQTFWYSDNGGTNWTLVAAPYNIAELPQWELITFNLSDIEALNNNPDTHFKIVFGGENTTITAGNNRVDNFTVKGVPISEELAFYSKAQGDITALNTWGHQPDGSGNSPESFGTMNTTYYIQNRTEAILSENWTVSGINSRVILGDGINPMALEVEATMNAALEVSNHATLHLTTSAYPEIVNLAEGSTAIFSNQATIIPYLNYHHIELHNIEPVFEGTGTIAVTGNLTLEGTVPMPDARDSDEYNWIFNGNSDQIINTGANVLRGYNLQFIKDEGNLTFTQNSFISSDNQMTFNFGVNAGFDDNGIIIYAGNSVNIGGDAGSYNFTGTLVLAGTEEGIVKGAGAGNNFNIRQGANTNAMADLNNIIIRAANTSGEFRFRDGSTNQLIIKGDFIVESSADGLIRFYNNEVILMGNLLVWDEFTGTIEDMNTLILSADQQKVVQLNKRLDVDFLTINNPERIILNGSIRVDNNLDFQNGKITTENDGVVTINFDGNITGFDENKYIEGHLAFRTMNTAIKEMIYPIGLDGNYRQVELAVTHADSATADYKFHVLPFDNFGAFLSPELEFFVEDYIYPLTKSGNSEITYAQISLPFDPLIFSFDLSLLRIAMLVDGGWVDLGGAVSGNKISSTINFTNAGTFALAKASESMPSDELIHFWLFDSTLENDTPLEEISSAYSILEGSNLIFESALEGYPFDPEHPLWRKASMERRNAPTPINYRSSGNNGIAYSEAGVRGIQVRQPFTGNGGQNTLIFNLPSSGFQNLKFSFAAKNEGAADIMLVEYSSSSGAATWTTTGMQSSILFLANEYSYYALDFSGIETVNNNPNFKIRITFDGSNMGADNDKRVTFNNFALDGETIGNHFQIIELSQGWSGVSSFIQPHNVLLDNILAPINNHLTILQNNQGIYWPSLGINTLNYWDAQAGYAIKMSGQTQLVISGDIIENPLLNLIQGWSYLPVLKDCMYDIDAFFSDYPDEIVMVKEVAGVGVYWPQFGINTLGYLVPGKAYYIKVNDEIVVEFADCNLKTSKLDLSLIGPSQQKVEPPLKSSWENFKHTSGSHVVAIPQMANSILKTGDHIGAFDKHGNCFGIALWNNQSNVITLFANDPSTSEKDGFEDGEPIIFRVFSENENSESQLSFDFDFSLPQKEKVFVTNGISALKDLRLASGNQISGENVSIFPNPAAESFEISINGFSGFETIRLEIFAADGVKMREESVVGGRKTIQTDGWTPGVYILKFDAGGSQFVKRLVKR